MLTEHSNNVFGLPVSIQTNIWHLIQKQQHRLKTKMTISREFCQEKVSIKNLKRISLWTQHDYALVKDYRNCLCVTENLKFPCKKLMFPELHQGFMNQKSLMSLYSKNLFFPRKTFLRTNTFYKMSYISMYVVREIISITNSQIMLLMTFNIL